jgi:hypothetical protein
MTVIITIELEMISDGDLTGFVNSLGCLLFVLITVYHFVSVNHPSAAR